MDDMLPARFQGLSERDLRAEYSRLRGLAIKRYKRLKAAGYEKTYAYKFAESRLSFKPQSELALRDLKYELYDLEEFTALEGSTVTGASARAQRIIESLHARGYTWINTHEELEEFSAFMEYARVQNAEHTVGSPTQAQKYREWRDASKTPEQIKEEFSQWLKSEKEAQEKAQALSDIYRAKIGGLLP